MKLLTLSLFVSICVAALSDLSVYHLGSEQTKTVASVSADDALLYFSDEFNLDMFKLSDYNKQEFIEFLELQHPEKVANHGPKLVLMLNGVKFNEKPSFTIKDGQHFYEQFNSLISNNANSVTDEINIIKIDSADQLKSHFKYFNHKLAKIWDGFKQTVFSSEIHHVNDQFFINEISQLVHLNEFEFAPNDVIAINLNSLNSLSNKIGDDSLTYKSSEKILNDLLNFSQFDIFVIDNVQPQTNKLSKRGDDLSKIFKSSGAASGCFETEENCQVNSDNCNSHGICSKLAKNCWSCVCSASFNETTSKTTNWSGFDCGKKDISSTANLLLWSAVALILLFVAGVKLLVSVGSEPLPAILDTK